MKARGHFLERNLKYFSAAGCANTQTLVKTARLSRRISWLALVLHARVLMVESRDSVSVSFEVLCFLLSRCVSRSLFMWRQVAALCAWLLSLSDRTLKLLREKYIELPSGRARPASSLPPRQSSQKPGRRAESETSIKDETSEFSSAHRNKATRIGG